MVEEELKPIPSKGWAEMIRKVHGALVREIFVCFGAADGFLATSPRVCGRP